MVSTAYLKLVNMYEAFRCDDTYYLYVRCERGHDYHVEPYRVVEYNILNKVLICPVRGSPFSSPTPWVPT